MLWLLSLLFRTQPPGPARKGLCKASITAPDVQGPHRERRERERQGKISPRSFWLQHTPPSPDLLPSSFQKCVVCLPCSAIPALILIPHGWQILGSYFKIKNKTKHREPWLWIFSIFFPSVFKKVAFKTTTLFFSQKRIH